MKIIPPYIDHRVLQIVAEIDEFNGRWQFLKSSLNGVLEHLKEVATIASIGSSTRIEGSQLSDDEIRSLLNDLEKKSFLSRDEEEVGGYAEAMDLVFENFKNIPLQESFIQQLHHTLLRYSSKDQHHKGGYKHVANDVAAFDAAGKQIGIIFKTSSPFDTPFHMKQLIEWSQHAFNMKEYHPILSIGHFILYFLTIHPFQDGNGRLSRILTTLLLLQKGYSYAPYCSLESIVEKNKKDYYLALRESQQSLQTDNPSAESWTLFFLQILKKQTEILSKEIETSQPQEAVTLSLGSQNILEYLAVKERATISDIAANLGANRNTVKTQLKKLLQEKMINKHGQGRGVWYTLRKKV